MLAFRGGDYSDGTGTRPMNSIAEIRIPREIVNDDQVRIVEWRASAGGRIKSGQVIVFIETSKAILEVESEADGFLEIVHPAGVVTASFSNAG